MTGKEGKTLATKNKQRNYAYIDGNNLHRATTLADNPWKVDLRRFRVLLEQKYRVTSAYYFVGAYDPKHVDLYTALQQYNFIVIFREHGINLAGKKKGNVDADIIFHVMRHLFENEPFDKVILVSGDGDYKRMVEYLIKIGRFERILLPCRKYASSLYKSLTARFFSFLDDPGMRVKIGLRTEIEKGS